MENLFEYAPGRYVVKSRVVAMSTYEKDGQIKVALDIDTANIEKKCLFSQGFPDMAAAKQYIQGYN